ncbi:primase C-terminal domain-containing protein [Jannaschia pohangensis]|uniref:Primase C terminal 1 (PriCT-1) n=1 Tax=Jannaschia pohangensis TaxID=390807 RepID=A0A1I3J1G3_9RHOB|nr:primase C-terminal domain-containing protein [Jannaschia pohangensis]SFI54039.1 Primase C terminal 1 (PriCT-1) [Jannaschia pohangensis]
MPLANKDKGGIDVGAFVDVFACDQNVHATGQATGEVGDNGKVEFAFTTQHRAPDKADYRRHLNGSVALAVCPFVDGKSKVLWACIDVDHYGEPGLAMRLEAQVRKLVWPCLVSESKSSGAYLWFFFQKPTPMAQVQPVLFAFAAALRLPGKYELFPATDKKVGGGRTVTLPCSGNTRRGIWQGEYIDPATFCRMATDMRTTVDALRALETDAGPYADWQPCIERLMEQGVPQGQRDDTMLQFAINAKRVNADPDAVAELVRDANEESFDPPLPEKQVREKLMAVMRNDYPPACNGDVLKPFCNRAECLRRRYGIAAGRVRGPMESLRKINYRPNPMWFALMADGRELEISDPGALLKQADFARLCITQLDLFHDQMKSGDWNDHIRQLLDTIVVVEPEGDSDAFGQLMTFFMEYVRSRKTDIFEGLLTGQVHTFAVDGGTHMQFRLHHFLAYLKRQGFRDLRSERVHHFLHSLGARAETLEIKGTKIDTLAMPYPEHDKEAPERDVPDYENQDGAY